MHLTAVSESFRACKAVQLARTALVPYKGLCESYMDRNGWGDGGCLTPTCKEHS